VVAAGLRFATLGAQSYWFDEAQAAHELGLSFGGMVSSMISHESNPPLYFVLAWLWAHVFGTGAVGLRAFSALAGTALIPVIYLSGRELISQRAGLVAAALAAVNPFLIWYSQEAREYMLLALLLGLSLLFFARFINRRGPRQLAWWAVFSALALLTHSFAAFLIAPEAIGVLIVQRNRLTGAAVGAVAVVQLALLPLILGHASNSLTGFIRGTPLAIRIKQVPVAFAANTLYQSSAVNWALYAAAGLAAVVIFVLAAGADRRELRGAGIAAALAGAVLLVPLLLALAGTDYYLARALIGAWVPLSLLIGAACTVSGLRATAGALAVVLAAGFVWAQAKIQSDPSYQRTDWAGVAAALGRPSMGQRAVVIYQGGLSTDPMAFYLPGTPWQAPRGPETVHEIDVVASPYQRLANPLPGGAQLISSRRVDQFVVDRFSLAVPWQLRTAEFAPQAGQLLSPASPDAAVLIQP